MSGPSVSRTAKPIVQPCLVSQMVLTHGWILLHEDVADHGYSDRKGH
jgi:hypothetical protein